MRLYLTSGLIAILLCSSCMTIDQNTSKPTKTKPLTRATTFVKQVSNTLTELTRDVGPVLKAMTTEASSELRGDLTKVHEEWAAQLTRPMPSRKNPSAAE